VNSFLREFLQIRKRVHQGPKGQEGNFVEKRGSKTKKTRLDFQSLTSEGRVEVRCRQVREGQERCTWEKGLGSPLAFRVKLRGRQFRSRLTGKGKHERRNRPSEKKKTRRRVKKKVYTGRKWEIGGKRSCKGGKKKSVRISL